MQGTIHVTENMSRVEKMRARKYNREIAYSEIEQYWKDNPVPKMTKEEHAEAKALIRKILLDKYPELKFD